MIVEASGYHAPTIGKTTGVNNVLVEDKKLIFMLVPKAASTAVKMMVATELLGQPSYDIRLKYVTLGEATGKFAAFRKIAVIRHPIERLQAAYQLNLLENNRGNFGRLGFDRTMSFTSFVRKAAELSDEETDVHLRGLCYNLEYRGKVLAKEVVRVENGDLVGWPTDLPKPLKMNSSQQSAFRRPTVTVERLARERYARDYEVFGYE